MNEPVKLRRDKPLVVGNSIVTLVAIRDGKVLLAINGPDDVRLNGQPVPVTELREPAPAT